MLEQSAIKKLRVALGVLTLNPKVICGFREIESSPFDEGAYAEVEVSDDQTLYFRFARDTYTSNVYVSINEECHNFGKVPLEQISQEEVTEGIKQLYEKLQPQTHTI